MVRANTTWSMVRNLNFISFIRELKVEPIIFIVCVGAWMAGTIVILGMYRVICLQTLGYDYPYFNCMNPTASLQFGVNYSNAYVENFHEAENKVQKANALWQMQMQISYAISAIIGNSIWSAVGDRYGRKINIMLGIAGWILDGIPYLFIFTFPMTPLYMQYITTVFTGFTGFQSIISINCYAYMADSVVDRNQLTIRLSIVQGLTVMAGMMTSMLVPVMMKFMTHAGCYFVACCGFVISFFYTYFFFEQVPPKIIRQQMIMKYIEEHGYPPDGISSNELAELQKHIAEMNTISEGHYNYYAKDLEITIIKSKSKLLYKTSIIQKIRSFFKEFQSIYKEIYATWRKPRPGKVRTYFLIVIMVFFFHITFEAGDVLSLYVLKSPFLWTPEQFTQFRTFTLGMRTLFCVVGIYILKKLLKFRDTSVVIFTMICNVVDMLMTAFAKTDTVIYIAQAVGCSLILLAPCLKSIITQLVDADEVGKAFLVFDIAYFISSLVSGVMYNGIYIATVSYFPGFVFLQKAVLQLFCIAAMVWLHIDYKRTIGKQLSPEKEI